MSSVRRMKMKVRGARQTEQYRMSSESFKPDLIIDENYKGSNSFLKVLLINE